MTETPKYSRQEISDESKRKSTAEEIRTASKGVDKKKTPEGKKELSQTWVQKANLTPAQKQALCDELLVKNIEETTAEELQRRVIALQKHLGFPEKDCDGILGWKTLEKVDQMVESKHKLEDEASGVKDNEDGYGFDRVANEETKEKDRTTRKEKLKTDLASGNTEGLTDADGKNLMLEESNGEKLLKGTGDNSDKYYNIETDTYETKAQRDERIAKQKKETQDEKLTESQIADIERAVGYSGSVDDTIDASGYNLDPSYEYKKTEGSIQRTKNGITEEWDTTAKKWTKEGETNTPNAKPTESQVADIERAAGYGAPGDSIDAGSYNLDPSYTYEKTDDSIQRTKDGATEVWDTTAKKWTKEGETNTPNAKPTESLAKSESNDPLFDLGTTYAEWKPDVDNNWHPWAEDRPFSDVKISELKDGIEDNWDTDEKTVGVKTKLAEAIVVAQKEPLYGDLTLGQYVELKKNPEGFLLDTTKAPSIRGSKRAEMVSKASGNGTQYTQEGKMWTKQEKGKTYVGVQGKFVDFEDYARTSLGATFSPTKVPGNPDKYYMVTFSPTGEKQITIGKRNKEGGIEQKGARYYSSNGGWKDSSVG